VSSESTDNTEGPREPHIAILKGTPTDAELAALITVLAGTGGAPAPVRCDATRWGRPEDRLRFAMSSHQRLTMQQMTSLK